VGISPHQLGVLQMTDLSQGVDESGADVAVTADDLYAVQVGGIRQAYGDEVIVKRSTYNFRVKKTDTGKKDEAGNAIIMEHKRPSVTVPIMFPAPSKISAILAGTGPARDLILQALENVAFDAGYEIIGADPTMTSATFPIELMDWDEIAKRAAAAGTSRGLDIEALKAFAEDYKSCMEAICGRPAEAVKNAADAFVQRFAKHRTSQKILSTLNTYLNMYIENAPNAAQYADVVEWLKAKLAELLSASADELYLL
jgi:hypothetical protein